MARTLRLPDHKWRNLFAAGLSAHAVAKKLGVAPNAAYYHRKRLGFAPKPRTQTKAPRAEVARLAAEGWTARQIADRFGICLDRAFDIARAQGVEPRPDPRRAPAYYAKLDAMLLAGERVGDIRRATGAWHTTIMRRRAKLGLQPRPRSDRNWLEVDRLLRLGVRVTRIEEVHGLYSGAVSKRRTRIGQPRRGQKRLLRRDQAERIRGAA